MKDLRGDELLPEAELRNARVDLAAVFRWFARIGMHEGVANHLSAAVSKDGSKFLMNPRGRHFSRVTASDLLLLDARDKSTLDRPDAPDPTAWFIHGRLHAELPQARCILHLHPINTTALSTLEDSSMPPIEQNTMRFFERIAFDTDFGGMALDDAEGDRLAGLLGNKSILMMGNHGITVTGPSIAWAFDEMFYFERAAEILMTAYASGRKLRVVPDAVARKTAQEWLDYPHLAEDHLREVKAILDREEPDYRD
ncbi:MAG TPA: class II aldolase and adducin N-terminal domain-containing protein [Candidatus Binatia bacterium]|nr:class II aldolase and adducin N-terminal domain-containing protein [Candidatus Binatia bacterium]